MLVKDLLLLFQAGNEGVINVLGEELKSTVFRLLTLYRTLFRDVENRCRASAYAISLLLQTDRDCRRISGDGNKATQSPGG